MIWIGYTTQYREGGRKFERAARTLRDAKRAAFPDIVVRCEPVESKDEFLEAMRRIEMEGESLDELHFIGHSGMYGIMFGTTSWPEQFSPYEWRSVRLPFAPGGTAYFHACRTARWFAPFFARTFQVPTYGYYWYTSLSLDAGKFRWDRLAGNDEKTPLYIVSIPGRKSHGLVGAALKYSGVGKVEQMRRFEPAPPDADTSYDSVAHLYDQAFEDITVRSDEWGWLERRIPEGGTLRLLDIGCGNGALLSQLADRIASGVGVDASAGMIEHARLRAAGKPNLRFEKINGPQLPFPDSSFDVVISFMSFRYLDWDPIMAEVRRVLAQGGRILIVDMAAAPVHARDLVRFGRSKARHLFTRVRHRRFSQRLQRLVSDPNWGAMLRYNPVRAEHEYRWYLESRFPGHSIEILNTGWTHRLLAFDSGPLEPGEITPLSYP